MLNGLCIYVFCFVCDVLLACLNRVRQVFVKLCVMLYDLVFALLCLCVFFACVSAVCL